MRFNVYVVPFFALVIVQACAQVQVTVRVAAKFQSTLCYSGDDCAPLYCGAPSYSSCSSIGYGSTPPQQTRWGTSRSSKSGLGFTPNTPINVTFDSDFFLGMLTHFNFPINNPAYQTTLILSVSVYSTAGSFLAGQNFSFTLLIDETSNNVDLADCVYPSSTPCADKISYPSGGFDANSKFVVNGVNYTLQLKGFKESSSSSSLALDSFISNESGQREGYLFARITAACPNICVGGGAVIINDQQQCVCDCTGLSACATPKLRAADCSCYCPANSCTNNGTVLSDCSCNCTKSVCPSPKVKNSDCSCSCPSNYCKNGGTISDYNTCACDCSTADLNCVTNQVVTPTCECLCNKTCTLPKIKVSNAAICDCVCNNTCPTGYSKDANTCNCTCSRTCPNGAVNYTDCSCGPCNGNWTKDVNGECTICGISQDDCSGLEELDPFICKCACQGLSELCNITLGKVPDSNQACGCRNCTAGECPCGNGIVEPGEECDFGKTQNQCCNNVTCTWMPGSDCDDGNKCSINDICYIGGLCKGVYKCDQSTTCTDIHCDTGTGECIYDQHQNGSICPSAIGRNDGNLCLKACQSGVCAVITPVQCIDNNTQDCLVPVCQNTTGDCIYIVAADDTACNDGQGCTTNDRCLSGVCGGDPKDCEALYPNVTECQQAKCDTSDGFCKVFPKANGTPCNDLNPCTLNDRCSNGQCVPRRKKRCPNADQCKSHSCDPISGNCLVNLFANTTRCDDNNICTVNDTCNAGTCGGVTTDETLKLPECGYVPSPIPNSAGQDTLIFFLAAGGAALIGAIVGTALIVKKIRRDKLLDPDTWNPDAFSSVGSNPFFKASQKMMDNRLYNPDTSVE